MFDLKKEGTIFPFIFDSSTSIQNLYMLKILIQLAATLMILSLKVFV